MAAIIKIVLSILGSLLGGLWEKIFPKKSEIEKAYEKADEAERGQAEAEHETAKLRRKSDYEDEMKKDDKEFWSGDW